ncbi:MAG: hypothetical protein U5L72_19160 [Bacteroidales bacterium]|nr:hypothetical protein [Bacteroidales bacterium]
MMKAVAGVCGEERHILRGLASRTLWHAEWAYASAVIVPTTSGNLCSCIDGPVFNINDLKWQTSG